MNTSLLKILLTFFGCVALTIISEQVFKQHLGSKRFGEMQQHIALLHERLQETLDTLVADNRTLAVRLQQQPDSIYSAAEAGLLEDIQSTPPVLSLALSRGHKIEFVHPLAGNEAALGIDYQLRPEFMRSIRRGKESKDTVVTSKVTLVQTGQPGMIIRTPYFDGDTYLGSVSTTIDIGMLLQLAQPEQNNPGYELLISAQHPVRGNTMVQGKPDQFQKLKRNAVLQLPEGAIWELRGRLEKGTGEASTTSIIRLTAVTLTTIIIFIMLRNSGVLVKSVQSGRRTAARYTVLMALLPVLVLTVAIEVLFFYTLQRSTKQLMETRANALSQQANDRIDKFFSIPRRSAFTTELFRQGILDLSLPLEMLGFFVSQLRLQPELTFLSVANTEGEYYAASRPPHGLDRNIRMQRATLETGREMRVHWANDNNTPSKSFERGNPSFDARTTIWYKQAIEKMSLRWYPVYRYGTGDSKNQFQELGIGMSAPLYNPDNQLIGVITADIALSQLSEFLKQVSWELGGTIFLAERDGLLLATSVNEPLTQSGEATSPRITMSQSANPLIRAAGQHIASDSETAGSQYLTIEGVLYLLDWHLIDIPDGPTLVQAVIIPSNILAGTALDNRQDVLFIGWLIIMLIGIVAMFFTNWLTESVSALERWASNLRRGNWSASMPPPGPIQEIGSLSTSLHYMVLELRNHTEILEEKVSQRTAELRDANLKLEQLSFTDSLTGLANRRCLDDYSPRLWQQAQRRQEPLSLLMADIDWFKKYNDHYGHLAGDRTLAHVASILAKHARRADDLVARYGGEEFSILLSDTSAEAAASMASSICQAITAEQIEHNGSPFGHVTISIGVATAYPGKDGFSLQKLFRDADEALYNVKNNGRNQHATLPELPELPDGATELDT